MNERIGNSFRAVLAAGMLAGAAAFGAAMLLLARGAVLDGVIVAAVTIFVFRWFWRATLRRRELVRRGFFTGRRVGSHWVYEELHEGLVVELVFPLEYVGRGEYDIHVPDENAWNSVVPDWARARRAAVLERLQSVFKFSQIHVESDPAVFRSADG